MATLDLKPTHTRLSISLSDFEMYKNDVDLLADMHAVVNDQPNETGLC